jgi:Rrf2 family nitric oxide-sensitive transcriptional repressor
MGTSFPCFYERAVIMRLTFHAEYSLRVLMYLALKPERLCSIAEIAAAYRISENHLTKVVHALGKQGFIETLRGRAGGLKLALPPATILLGDVLRRIEGEFEGPDCQACPALPACGLTGVFGRAYEAFLGVFNQYTVADTVKDEARLKPLLLDIAIDRA